MNHAIHHTLFLFHHRHAGPRPVRGPGPPTPVQVVTNHPPIPMQLFTQDTLPQSTRKADASLRMSINRNFGHDHNFQRGCYFSQTPTTRQTRLCPQRRPALPDSKACRWLYLAQAHRSGKATKPRVFAQLPVHQDHRTDPHQNPRHQPRHHHLPPAHQPGKHRTPCRRRHPHEMLPDHHHIRHVQTLQTRQEMNKLTHYQARLDATWQRLTTAQGDEQWHSASACRPSSRTAGPSPCPLSTTSPPASKSSARPSLPPPSPLRRTVSAQSCPTPVPDAVVLSLPGRPSGPIAATVTRKEVPMSSSRHWFSSNLSPCTVIYVEVTRASCSDGMPKEEHKLLASIYQQGQTLDAVVWLPDQDIFMPGYTNMLAAQTAIVNQLSHAHTPQPQSQLL